MEMTTILRRIELRLGQLKTTAAAISRAATGSPDTIRNWQRRVRNGETPGASTATIERIATALEVSAEWLAGAGQDGPDGSGETTRAELIRAFDQLDPAMRPVALRQIQALAAIEARGRADALPEKED